MRYHFYTDKKNSKVICVSSYAKKPVKAYAKCSPEDEFDFEQGSELARLRVDEKIAEKRVKRAQQKVKEATRALEEAQAHLDHMKEYLQDSIDIKNSVVDALDIFRESL